ncbi:MAG: hypothetical protein K6E30_05495 [Lachnospiraceae bacterium]|nr:hypothetical protein [Lachnospiraceae bacterium]
MAVMDEFKEEREAIRHASLSKKFGYFKDYYLIPLLIGLAAAAFIIALAWSVLSQKEEVLYVSLINFADLGEADAAVKEPFEEAYINSRKEKITVDRSIYISSNPNEANFVKYGYEDEQKLLTLTMTGSIDLLVSGEDIIERYAAQGMFEDLREIAGEDWLAPYEEAGKLLYYGDLPVALSLRDSEIFNGAYYYSGEEDAGVYAAFPAGAARRELALSFLEFLQP